MAAAPGYCFVGEGVDERDADFSELKEFPASATAAEGAEGAEEETQDGPRAEELEALKAEAERTKAELDETKDRYIRLLAEFENFKKRTLKERADLLKYQGERVILDLLDVVDDFERALQHGQGDAAQFLAGVELIHKKFMDLFGRWEVRAESGMGQPFDPEKHSALSRVPAGDQAPGTIVAELRKPYYYKDKLLRHGEVVVAAEEAEEGPVQ